MLKTHHWQDIQSVSLEMHRSPSLCVAVCVAAHYLNSKLHSDGITITRANMDHYSAEESTDEPFFQTAIFKDPTSDVWILSRTIPLSGLAPITLSALYHEECSGDDEKVFDLICENIGIASQHLPPLSEAPLKDRVAAEDSDLVVVGENTDEADVAPLLAIRFHLVEAAPDLLAKPQRPAEHEGVKLSLVR